MNGLSTMLAIVRREYLTRVRRRAFVVATVLGPLLTVGLIAGLVLLTQSTEDPVKVCLSRRSPPVEISPPPPRPPFPSSNPIYAS